jgi:hypothetical protein
MRLGPNEIGSHQYLFLMPGMVLAEDYEIQEPSVTITRTQAMQAFIEVFDIKFSNSPLSPAMLEFKGKPPPLYEFELILKKLGLDP